MPAVTKSLVIAVFPYSGWSEAELQARAAPVQPPARREGRSLDRRRSFYAGRAALATALQSLGVSARVEADSIYGYLRLIGPTGLFGNISHTQELAVAAVSPSPIGVDVESIHRDARKVMRKVANDGDRAFLARGPTRVAGPEIAPEVVVWSAKEAFSKALGLGMKFGMRAFEVDFDGIAPFIGKTSLKGPLALVSPAISLLRHDDYLISLCGERAVLGLEFRLLTCYR